MSSNNDVVMNDTATTSSTTMNVVGSGIDADMNSASGAHIRNKLLNLMNMHMSEDGKIPNALADEEEFELDDVETENLRSLKHSQAQPVVLNQNLGTDSTTEMNRYDIRVGNNGVFLDLACYPGAFYSRFEYKDLYDRVASKWRSIQYRVVLIGNAGI